MKILLVATPQSPNSIDSGILGLFEPLALEYLGAGIRKDHDVRLLDLRIANGPGLKETLESFNPDIIGCGAFTNEVNPAKKICAEAKKLLPGILTVVGGQHATVKPGDFFEDNIDVVVMGEGSLPFQKICQCHEQQKSFAAIENVYYRNHHHDENPGEMVFTWREEHPPLDSLPFPDRSLTSHARRHYLAHMVTNQPTNVASVRSSLGCVYRCKFCAVSGMLNRKIYRHSIERVIEELETVEEPLVLWVDDEMLLDAQRAVALARAIGQTGIQKNYIICGRSDTIIKNPQTIEEWARVGLKLVFIGMESHRESDLTEMKKGTTVSRNEEALHICHANNVDVRGSFIIQPDFAREDFKQLAEYVRNLGVDQPSFSVLTPFPGTELYEETKQDLITTNYDLFDMLHTVLPTRLPLKEFYKEYSRVTVESVSPEIKERLFEQMTPKMYQQVLSILANYFRRLENGYKDYQKPDSSKKSVHVRANLRLNKEENQ
ncbi:MAG: cobalamin-dependent protein [Candidatus Aminicenantes bacterium]|nr:MAG: cobalamin-dependent protein [Candidatus Aminicenantes bacterium]